MKTRSNFSLFRHLSDASPMMGRRSSSRFNFRFNFRFPWDKVREMKAAAPTIAPFSPFPRAD
jgi:hypothetical protein